MKSLGSFTKIFSVLSYGPQLRPVRDWLVLLIVFVLLLLASVGWNLWLFNKVTKGEKIGDVPVSQPVDINLDQVKQLFENRAAERMRYTGEYRFVDPSI